MDGDARPLLCKDPETANLVVDVLGRAIQANAGGDADKAKSLFEVAAKLESEICLKPAADDIVILRCNLGDKSFGGTRISLAKISALLKADSSAGEQPFYAWTYAAIEPAADGASAGDADKKWCKDEVAADAPLEPRPDLIQQVQQRFYDFGFGKKWRGDYSVASVPVPHCIAISTTRYKTRRRTFTQAFTSMGDSAGEASQNSLDYATARKAAAPARRATQFALQAVLPRRRATTAGTSRSTPRPRSPAASRSATIRTISPPTRPHPIAAASARSIRRSTPRPLA
ncbi:MAG TPA: hypothetical protein VLD66_01995 [Methyloceanibacter sp.]|nr:hypothetical protein [Methyloceanibacter sp.]